jgi:hypothetical protein
LGDPENLNIFIIFSYNFSELHNLYSFPNKIRVNKSKRMRWAGHVAGMGENMNAYRILMGNPE